MPESCGETIDALCPFVRKTSPVIHVLGCCEGLGGWYVVDEMLDHMLVSPKPYPGEVTD